MSKNYIRGWSHKRLNSLLLGLTRAKRPEMKYVHKETGQELVAKRSRKNPHSIDVWTQDFSTPDGAKGYKVKTVSQGAFMDWLVKKDDNQGPLADYQVPVQEQVISEIVNQILNEDTNIDLSINNFRSVLRNKVVQQKKSNIISAWMGGLQ